MFIVKYPYNQNTDDIINGIHGTHSYNQNMTYVLIFDAFCDWTFK